MIIWMIWNVWNSITSQKVERSHLKRTAPYSTTVERIAPLPVGVPESILAREPSRTDHPKQQDVVLTWFISSSSSSLSPSFFSTSVFSSSFDLRKLLIRNVRINPILSIYFFPSSSSITLSSNCNSRLISPSEIYPIKIITLFFLPLLIVQPLNLRYLLTSRIIHPDSSNFHQCFSALSQRNINWRGLILFYLILFYFIHLFFSILFHRKWITQITALLHLHNVIP